MYAMKFSVIFFVGSVCVLLLLQCASSQLCPHCVCRSSYSPVCSMNKVTGKLRGFPNKCVFNCTNKCRDNRFVYLGPGRCGQYASSTTAIATQKEVITTPIPYVTLYKV